MKKNILTLMTAAGLMAAGSAFAGPTCGDANLAPWFNVREDVAGQLDVVAPGLGATACTLQVNATATNTDRARVQDRSPQCETSFRAAFRFNADAVGTLASNERNKLFNVQCNNNTNGGFGCPGVGVMQFRLQGDGANNNILRSFVSDENQGDLRNRFDVPVASGENTLEIQWIQASSAGASDGVLRGWWNNTTEASPDLEITNLNNGRYCIDQINLGIIGATNAWANNHAGENLLIDEYESRRQTGILVQ